jgi:hypothetical protein
VESDRAIAPELDSESASSAPQPLVDPGDLTLARVDEPAARARDAGARRAWLRHHGPVTDPTPEPLPADPVAYDDPRNAIARRKGLEQPYITGGDDPELDETLRRERPYVKLLVAMVVAIVLIGFVLGFIGALIGAPRV